MIKILATDNPANWQYEFQATDVQKLRAYLNANGGKISQALRSLDAEGLFEGLNPTAMIEVVRFCEKAMADPHWCSPEHVEELKKTDQFKVLIDATP